VTVAARLDIDREHRGPLEDGPLAVLLEGPEDQRVRRISRDVRAEIVRDALEAKLASETEDPVFERSSPRADGSRFGTGAMQSRARGLLLSRGRLRDSRLIAYFSAANSSYVRREATPVVFEPGSLDAFNCGDVAVSVTLPMWLE